MINLHMMPHFIAASPAEALLRQAELEGIKSSSKDGKGEYGPLTQRLIAVSMGHLVCTYGDVCEGDVRVMYVRVMCVKVM